MRRVILLATIMFLAGVRQVDAAVIRTSVDLNIGESQTVSLYDGSTATVKLIGKTATRDSVRNAVRKVRVTVQVNGVQADLWSGNYQLPVTVGGVQIDCPITDDYLADANENNWNISKSARFRLWPAGSAWIEPGTLFFPLKTRWFVTDTQIGNEPTYVNGDEVASGGNIYYHSGTDIGGTDKNGMITKEDVLATVNGTVSSAGGDVVSIRDSRGWTQDFYHLSTIFVLSGQSVTGGQTVIGTVGQAGASGGWSHLHYSVYTNGASEYMYPYLWEVYTRNNSSKIMAVARPHQLLKSGETATLDGTKSKSLSGGSISSYLWTFTDGSIASGATINRTYSREGTYSEMLKVTDNQGNVAYDFVVIQVINPSNSLPHTISVNYTPSVNLQPGSRITFNAKIFRNSSSIKEWDFGDGSARQTTGPSGDYDTITHTYNAPGDYIVTVREATSSGPTVMSRMWVRVGSGGVISPPPTSIPTVPGSNPGDADGDGDADETDFNIWKTYYKTSQTGASNGDFNGNGVVDGADYVIWLNNYT